MKAYCQQTFEWIHFCGSEARSEAEPLTRSMCGQEKFLVYKFLKTRIMETESRRPNWRKSELYLQNANGRLTYWEDKDL